MRTHTSRSDIIFAEAEPFDFKFSQSQQSGGGGGGMGNEQNDISERQKQIIAATWNQERNPGKLRPRCKRTPSSYRTPNRSYRDQAKTLAERMSSREMEGAGSSFANFSKLMTQAAGQMDEAVEPA